MLISAVATETHSYSPGPKCLACKDRDLYKEITKQSIKEDILRKLGFSAPPVIPEGNILNSLQQELVRKEIEQVTMKIQSRSPITFILIKFIQKQSFNEIVLC